MAWRRLPSLTSSLIQLHNSVRCFSRTQIVMESAKSLLAMESFAKRHIGPSETDRQEMLRVCGVQVSDSVY